MQVIRLVIITAVFILALTPLHLLIIVMWFEIKEKTGAMSGNLSVQIDKLKQAEYLTVTKSFKKNYPLTVCKITPKGRIAFEKYVKHIKLYLKGRCTHLKTVWG